MRDKNDDRRAAPHPFTPEGAVRGQGKNETGR